MLKGVHDAEASNENTTGAAGGSLLDEVVRDGARQMPAAALQAEVTAHVEQFIGEVDEQGRRLVVHNGYHRHAESVSHSTANLRKGQSNDRPGRGTGPASDRRTHPTSGGISRRGRT
jgi:hypothetical protein